MYQLWIEQLSNNQLAAFLKVLPAGQPAVIINIPEFRPLGLQNATAEHKTSPRGFGVKRNYLFFLSQILNFNHCFIKHYCKLKLHNTSMS